MYYRPYYFIELYGLFPFKAVYSVSWAVPATPPRQPVSEGSSRTMEALARIGRVGNPLSPAHKVIALHRQRQLPELDAAVGLQFRLGETCAAVSDVGAAVAALEDNLIILSP